MKIKQLNSENVGIEWNGEKSPVEGYQHHDALWFQEDKHNTYKMLAVEIYNQIIQKRDIHSILELGCGAGSLSYWLRDICKITGRDMVIVTLDGNKETVNSPYLDKDYHFILRTDREYNLVNDSGDRMLFDLVLSFEHFEHISGNDNLTTFFSNIVNHIHVDSLILATASLQHGSLDWHPTVLPYQEWKRILENAGFCFIPSNFLRRETIPFNFLLEQTSELFFKLK